MIHQFYCYDIEERCNNAGQERGGAFRVAQDDGETLGIKLEVVGVRDNMPKTTQVSQCRQDGGGIHGGTHAGHGDAQAVDEFRMPSTIVIDVILKGFGDA